MVLLLVQSPQVLQRGALLGAFTGAVGGGVAQSSLAGNWGGIAVNATASGITSELNGGSFGSGFVSAGLSGYLAPHINSGNAFQDGVANAMIGGTISTFTGGKFANGAITAAYAYSFNKLINSAYVGMEADERTASTSNAGEDLFSDVSNKTKATTALNLVRETCPTEYHCDVPNEFEIADIGETLVAHTNVYTRTLTFNSRLLDFKVHYDIQQLLDAAYHETMHRGDPFRTRWADAAAEAAGYYTDNHESIYARALELAIKNLSTYESRLNGTRAGH